MADSMRIDRSSPWHDEIPRGIGIEIAARTARDRQRQSAKHRLLRSVRETLAEAEPVADGITSPPADGVALADTRARIVAALSEVDRIESAMTTALGRAASDDPAAVAAAQALAEQIFANRGDSIAAQARIGAETVKIVIER